MKKTNSSLIAVAALVVFGTLGTAEAAGTTGAEFLKMGAGARAAGMGDAFSSVANDVTSAYWNPAGLAQLEAPEVSAMHDAALIGAQYQYVGGALPYGNSVVALSLSRLDYGSIERYSNNPAEAQQGTFDAGSMALSASVAKKMSDTLQIGGSFKVLQEKLEAEKASAVAVDAGALWKLQSYNVSAVIQHLGTPMKFVQEKSDLPTTITIGGSTKFFEEKLLTSVDIAQAKGSNLALRAGVEYTVHPTVTLRAGYHVQASNAVKLSGLTGLTGGLGVNLGKFSIDYAMMPFGDFGLTHKISLTAHFSK